MSTTIRRSLLAIIVLALSCQLAAQKSSDLVSEITQLNQQIQVTRPGRGLSRSTGQQSLESTVAARQAVVEELIRTNPSAVRSVRLSPTLTSSLPPSVANMVEADVQAEGILEKTIADDFENHRSQTLWNLHTQDRRMELVFGEGSHPERLLGKKVAISGIGTPNVVAVESVDSKISEPKVGVSSMAPAQASCSTLGTQNVAVLMMNQGAGGSTYPAGVTASYLDDQYFSAVPKSVPTYWTETSVNQTTASGQVFGPFTLDRVYTCGETNALATKAISLAKAGGVDFSGFSRISIVFPTDSMCGFGGLGDVGCRASDAQVSHPYSVSWIPIFSYYTGATELWGTLVHEFGHNLGLGHGNSLDFGDSPLGTIDYTPIPPNSGSPSQNTAVNKEYGDNFTVMGKSSCGGQYSGFAKTHYLNWLPLTDLYEVTTSGNFTIGAFENMTGPRAIRVLRDPVTSSWLWLEYRQPQGTYDALLQGCLPGTNVHSGALGYYEDQFSADGHLYLLDFHPTSAPNDFVDAALEPGEVWQDPYSPLSISVSNADGSGLSVSVSYAQPCQTLAISAASFPASSASGTVTVTAPSNCSWEASAGSDWITLTGPTTGTGNGSVTFNLPNNTDFEQRTGFIYVSRRSVTVSQKGTATYVKLMSPSFGAGAQATIPFTFDDPLGSTDINYARIIFENNDKCEIDLSQSGTFAGFFVYDAASGTFSPFIMPGDNVTYGNGHCSLTGVGTTVTRNGNQLQIVLNMSFDPSFAGSHRVTVSVCDSVSGCSSDIALGTWQVPFAAAISQLSPDNGKQGNVLSVTAFGINTHFGNDSTIQVSGTGVTISGVSASSPTEISGTFNIDVNAPAGPRTVTITSGPEIVTSTFTVGASGRVSVSPASLNFPQQVTGTTSASLPLTLTNIGNAPLGISSINAVGEFGVTHNCGASLAINASCTMNVTFSPLLGGYRPGNVIINDDAPGSPHFVPLTGLGKQGIINLRKTRTVRPDFTVSLSQSRSASLAVALPKTTSADAQISCLGSSQLNCSVTAIENSITGPIARVYLWSDSAMSGSYQLRLKMQDGERHRTLSFPLEIEDDEEETDIQ